MAQILKEFHGVTSFLEVLQVYLKAFQSAPLAKAQVLSSLVSVARVHFRVRGLIRLVGKRMESHLSCQIQLCALLSFQEKRFSIFLTSAWVFFFVLLHPSFSVTLLPNLCFFFSILPLSPPLFVFVPCGCG